MSQVKKYYEYDDVIKLLEKVCSVTDGNVICEGKAYMGLSGIPRNVENFMLAKSLLDSAELESVRNVTLCHNCELWNEWDHCGRKEYGNFVCSCAHWSNDGYAVYTGPDDFCSKGEPKIVDEEQIEVIEF